MKNPLRKRLPRELKGELGKYLVVFILMVASIGFVSGFLVADNSMLIAYNEGFEKYNIEDGNFRTAEQVHKTQREEIEALGVKLYDNYYVEEPLDNGSTMRFFKNRQQVDKVCLMKGELPARQERLPLTECMQTTTICLWEIRSGAEKEPGKLPAWWHFPTTVACFRITTIPCLML